MFDRRYGIFIYQYNQAIQLSSKMIPLLISSSITSNVEHYAYKSNSEILTATISCATNIWL